MKSYGLFAVISALNLALGVQAGISKQSRSDLVKGPTSVSPSEQGAPASSEAKGYRIEKFSIGYDPPGSEEVKLSIEYNHRTVWTGTAAAPGDYELPVEPDTNFQEDPPPGYSRNDNIYHYLRSANYASQWHTLRQTGRELKFNDTTKLDK